MYQQCFSIPIEPFAHFSAGIKDGLFLASLRLSRFCLPFLCWWPSATLPILLFSWKWSVNYSDFSFVETQVRERRAPLGGRGGDGDDGRDGDQVRGGGGAPRGRRAGRPRPQDKDGAAREVREEGGRPIHQRHDIAGGRAQRVRAGE